MPVIIPSVFWPLVGLSTFFILAVCSFFVYYCVDSYRNRRNRVELERLDPHRTEASTAEQYQMRSFSSQSSLSPILETFEGGGFGHRSSRDKDVDLRRVVLTSRTRYYPGYTNFVDLTWRPESDQSMGSSLARSVISDDVCSSALNILPEEEEEEQPPLYSTLTGDFGGSLPRTSTMMKEEEPPLSEKNLKTFGWDDDPRELERAYREKDSSLYAIPNDYIISHNSRHLPGTIKTGDTSMDDFMDIRLGRRDKNEENLNGSISLSDKFVGCGERDRDLPGDAREGMGEEDGRESPSAGSRYRGIWRGGDTPNFGVNRSWSAAQGTMD